MGKLIEKQIDTRVSNLIFVGFLVIYAIFLIVLSNSINIFEDEAFSMNTSSHALGKVLAQSYNFEGQPPVYFVLLAIWRKINSGILFARFFSIISIAFSAFLLYKTVRLFTDIGNARWLVVIFLLNPYSVWAATEIRTYALLIFLSSTALFFYIKYIISNRVRHLYYFLIICLVGLYTQYFFAFLMVALAGSVLLFKGWKAFFRLCLFCIPVIILFVPNLYHMSTNLSAAKSVTTDYSLLQRISVVLHTPQNLLLALQIGPLSVWIRWVIKIIFVLLVTLAYVITYRKYHQQNPDRLKYINGIITTCIIVTILFALFNGLIGIWWGDKYFAIGFPVFMLVFTLFLAYSLAYKRLIFVALSFYFIFMLKLNFSPPVKDYDYKSIAGYISAIEHKNEPILCYSDLISLPLAYYYHGVNILAPLPEAPSFDKDYIKNINDTANLKQTIEKKYGTEKSYLLVSDDNRKNSMHLNMNREMIDNYLSTHYKITLDTLNYGRSKNQYLRVRRLETIP